MGKRSAAVSAADTPNGQHHGGPSTKKTKYNGQNDHQQQQEHHDETESPKPEFHLSRELVNGAILTDLMKKKWRIGNPIGKGSFGEIFLASDNITQPVTDDNAEYVVKIEPHSNGPLFVEIHCLLNTAKATDNNPLPPGMPEYIASGSHYFKNTRYRFLVLKRFDRDLHSIIKNCKVDQISITIIAVQILEVLEHLHDKGYCHSDIKAENLMISKCTYHKNHYQQQQQQQKQIKQENDSDNDDENEQDYDNQNDKNYNENIKKINQNNKINMKNNLKQKKKYKRYSYDEDFNVKEENEDDDDDDDDNDDDKDDKDYIYEQSKNKSKKNNFVQYGGSNPVRSCRLNANRNKDNKSTTSSTISATTTTTNQSTIRTSTTTTYQEMINSHYLRPTKKINYSQFFGDDTTSKSSSGDESTLDEYITRHRHKLNKKQPTISRRNNSSSSVAAAAATATISSNKNKHHQNHQNQHNNQQSTISTTTTITTDNDLITEDRIFLIDFGLASKFIDSNGQHHPFCLDQRRAHDGTLEFTSRDAHMGAHSRRSDLECLGYNLLLWSQGYLPWKDYAKLQQHENVHRLKEFIMNDVEIMLKLYYNGKNSIPNYLINYMLLVCKLTYHERPNYKKFKNIFKKEYERLTNKSSNTMKLNIQNLIKNSINIKNELLTIQSLTPGVKIKISDDKAIKNIKMLCKNLGIEPPQIHQLKNGNDYNTFILYSPFSLNNHLLQNNILNNSLQQLQQQNNQQQQQNNCNLITSDDNNSINCLTAATVGIYNTPKNCINGYGCDKQRLSPKNLRSKDKFLSISKTKDLLSTKTSKSVNDSTTITSSSSTLSALLQSTITPTLNNKKRNNKNYLNLPELLNKDPDQIARERCDKEFEREETLLDDTPIRYKGKPTYAILEIENRIKFKDRLNDTTSTPYFNNYNSHNNSYYLDDNLSDDNNLIHDLQLKGFTKPMIDIVMKKRKSSLMMMNTSSTILDDNNYNSSFNNIKNNQEHQQQQQNNHNCVKQSSSSSSSKLTRPRTKAGLRTVITPTKRGLDYNHSLIKQRQRNIISLKQYDIDKIHTNTNTTLSHNNYNIIKNTNTNDIIDIEESSYSSNDSNSRSTNNTKKSSISLKTTTTTSSSSLSRIATKSTSSSLKGNSTTSDNHDDDNDDQDDDEDDNVMEASEDEDDYNDNDDDNYDDNDSGSDGAGVTKTKTTKATSSFNYHNHFTTTASTTPVTSKNKSHRQITNQNYHISSKKEYNGKAKTTTTTTATTVTAPITNNAGKTTKKGRPRKNTKPKRSTSRKKKAKVKRKISLNLDGDDDDEDDEDDDQSSNFRYYPVDKQNGDNAVAATFRKRLKRTRSG